MAFVIDENGKYLPVFGSTEGGGNVDDILSPTSTNPVQNKILYPALSEFIPANTQIDVELDGSGDFTTIADAISYLDNKWSNGAVTIQLGSGTFNITSAIVLSNKTIPLIYLKGKGQNSTIISTSASVGIQVNTGVTSTISALKIVKSTDTKTGTGIQVDAGTLRFENMTFDNFNLGIANLHGAVHLLSGNIFMNCNTGVHVERIGTVVSNLGSTISFSSVGTAWKVATGGMIATSTPTTNITYTSVTTKCSQTVGQFNANGYIGGTLQN